MTHSKVLALNIRTDTKNLEQNINTREMLDHLILLQVFSASKKYGKSLENISVYLIVDSERGTAFSPQ